MKTRPGHSIPLLREPDAASVQPLYRRLCRRIREGILHGAIAPGTRLPSARTLAREEGVSRNTVEAALRQLTAEGFLFRRVGSSTYVRNDIGTELLTTARPPSPDGAPSGSGVTAGLSRRALAGRRLEPRERMLAWGRWALG